MKSQQEKNLAKSIVRRDKRIEKPEQMKVKAGGGYRIVRDKQH